MFEYFSELFDRIFTQARVHFIEQLIIYAAVLGFSLHLMLIGVAKLGFGPDRLLELAGPGFFTALYTPFSFILVYEVFVLILALSKSFTSSIGVLYQIIALIFVRRIFGDIGHVEDVGKWSLQNEWVRWLLFDMAGALTLFLLVTIFLHISKGAHDNDYGEAIQNFIHIKKTITLFVAFLSFAIGIYNLSYSALKVLLHVSHGDGLGFEIDFVFYKNLFTLLVFADVLVLLAGYRYSDEFSLIFRNVGFVISTVLLRLSMSVPRPRDVAVAVISFLFGICVLLIFRYYRAINAKKEVQPETENAVSLNS